MRTCAETFRLREPQVHLQQHPDATLQSFIVPAHLIFSLCSSFAKPLGLAGVYMKGRVQKSKSNRARTGL
jgi:hypothetical protein